MKDMGMKQNILKEIMDMMDMNEGEKLKKHPKFAKVSVLEIEKKPKGEEMPPMMEKEKEEGGEDELSPEMIEQLLEQLQKEKE